MRILIRILCAGMFAFCFAFTSPQDASAQYAVAVTPVAPAVVGYAPERRGLFGRRVVYRPVVTPVAAAVRVAPVTVARPVVTVARPVVTVARPVVTVARPVVTVSRPVVTVSRPVVSVARPVVTMARPVVTVARPVVTAPVTSYYAPAVAPVTTYYPPPAPVVTPIIGF